MSTTAFAFGNNWLSFLRTVDESAVRSAEHNLTAMLGDVSGKSFLDIGCGSGLASLAAYRLGAKVRSFDIDPECVRCTQKLQRKFNARWPVEQGSVLDTQYLAKLGKFDIVYSWGVLHHTGDMWKALGNVLPLVSNQLWIAIYNDQGWRSRYWHSVKRTYNTSLGGKIVMTTMHLPYLVARLAARTVRGKLNLSRGMSIWHDYIDWLGGYPFQVATPNDVISFLKSQDFEVSKVVCTTRLGCNEFLFLKT